MLTTALCAFAMAVQESPKTLPPVQMGKAQLVFLVDKVDRSKPVVVLDVYGRHQKQHLAFLQKLWVERRVLVAGPLLDAGARKELVVLDVDKPEEAQALMADDPMVKSGELALETHTWFFAKNYIVKGAEFAKDGQYWFGRLDRASANLPKLSEEEGNKLQDGHMANIIKMANEGALLIAGPLAEPTDFRGIFIFNDLPKADIDKLTAVDPLIKSGRLKLTLYKLRAPRGSFLAEKT